MIGSQGGGSGLPTVNISIVPLAQAYLTGGHCCCPLFTVPPG